MTGFHEVRFPDNIAYGATGGPEFATTGEPRGRSEVGGGLKNQQPCDLIAFFRAIKVRTYGFRSREHVELDEPRLSCAMRTL